MYARPCRVENPMSHIAENLPPAATVLDIATLNTRYLALSPAQRIQAMYRDFEPAKVMVTSSFAATSAYFLHVLSRARPEQTVLFIAAGFHFPETLAYKDYLIERFGPSVRDERHEEWKHVYSAQEQVYRSDPDFCCSVNKVEPLEEMKKDYQVWVSSLMRWQTPHRAGLDLFEVRRGIVKFDPMIDVTRQQRDDYIREHDLPGRPRGAGGGAAGGGGRGAAPGGGRGGRG